MRDIALAQRSPDAPPELPVTPSPGPDFPPEDEPPDTGNPEFPATPEISPDAIPAEYPTATGG